MKKITFILFFWKILTLTSYAQIVYIDMNLILKNSEVGKALTEKINQLNNNHIVKFREIEKKLIAKEKTLLAQKNILDNSEFEKRLTSLSEEIKKFRNDKKMSETNINKIKIENTKEILKLLNPIITNYVEVNAISLVMPKKNIIVGKKNLDITDQIINLLNKNAKNLKF